MPLLFFLLACEFLTPANRVSWGGNINCLRCQMQRFPPSLPHLAKHMHTSEPNSDVPSSLKPPPCACLFSDLYNTPLADWWGHCLWIHPAALMWPQPHLFPWGLPSLWVVHPLYLSTWDVTATKLLKESVNTWINPCTNLKNLGKYYNENSLWYILNILLQ